MEFCPINLKDWKGEDGEGVLHIACGEGKGACVEFLVWGLGIGVEEFTKVFSHSRFFLS